jgi:serine/threonine protein phosphatase 1
VAVTWLARALGRFSRRTGAGGPTEGRLIYAIGDVHGRYDLMTDLLARIVRDGAARAAGRRPLVIFCGDYVDRGPDSARVMEALTWLQRREDVEVRLLKGNHEQALMSFIDAPEKAGPWLRFGGDATLAAYGVAPPEAEDDPARMRAARDALLERMPSSHLRLIEQMELMFVIGDYAFVHAGIEPGVALADQTEDQLLWIRDGFIGDEGPFEKVIVHGHTWTDGRPALLPHRIGLDTGAYATGVLTAVRFDGEDMAVLQVRDPALELTATA